MITKAKTKTSSTSTAGTSNTGKKPASTGIARKAIGTGQNVANSLLETNRSIWLAGLGAVTSLGRKAGEHSPSFPNFEALVKAGEALEERSRAFVDTSTAAAHGSVNSVATKVDGKLEEFESVFDRRIAGTLERLNIPSRTELAILVHRIETLEAEIKALREKGI